MGNGPRKAKHCGCKHTLVVRPRPEGRARCAWGNPHHADDLETVELLQNIEAVR